MNIRRKRTFTILGVLLVVIALPLTIILARNQQNNQSSAHTPTPTATAVCQGTEVIVSSTYNLTNIPKNVTCQITATDSETYLDDSFPFKNGDSDRLKSANTHKSTISPGVVTFNTTCIDGFKQTNSASYSLSKPCVSPTPTPMKTLSPTPTMPQLTPTPPVCTANKSTCTWDAQTSAISYHYQVFDANSNTLLTEGDVNAPHTFVQFPSTNGQSYKCSVSAVNACGTGQPGTGQFSCTISPTPSVCVTPATPQNIKVTCPNCNQ